MKADTEIVNSIQYGKMKIVAQLGELMPATPRNETGRGKKKTPVAGTVVLGETAAIAYRKVAKNKDKLDGYYAAVKESGEELTQAGFIRHATGTEKAGTAAHVSANTGVPEWYTLTPHSCPVLPFCYPQRLSGWVGGRGPQT